MQAKRKPRARQNGPSAQIIQLRSKVKPAPKRKKGESWELMRQRNLAWMLYITEGAAANMAHALAVNCVTFNSQDTAMVRRLMKQHDAMSAELRHLLSTITDRRT